MTFLSRMRLRGTALIALAMLISACSWGYRLELELSNQSATTVVVTVVAGIDGTPEAEASDSESTIINETMLPGARRAIKLLRPDEWTVRVNGSPVTDAEEWPSDNPTISLGVVVNPDGSAVVIDI